MAVVNGRLFVQVAPQERFLREIGQLPGNRIAAGLVCCLYSSDRGQNFGSGDPDALEAFC
jgi:hypothetical protein